MICRFGAALFLLMSATAFASGGHAPNPEERIPESQLGLSGQQYALELSPAMTGGCGWGAESAARQAFQKSVQADAIESCAPGKFVRVLDYPIRCHAANPDEQSATPTPACEGSSLTVCGLEVNIAATAICEENAGF